MLRITGGKYRGRTIETRASLEARPTTALVRESLFNILQTRIQEARFLDLYAGSGVIGVEALSRGAQFVLSVEKNRDHCRQILRNLEKLNISRTQLQLLHRSVEELIARPPHEGGFDIIFLDPPYGSRQLLKVLTQLKVNGWLAPDGILIVEQSSRDPALPGFTTKNYGGTVLAFRYPVPPEESPQTAESPPEKE